MGKRIGKIIYESEGILIERDQVINSLRYAVKSGETGLWGVPGLLKRVLKEDMWQERLVIKTRQVERFNDFKKFVETPPMEGLGATVELIERLCKDDGEVMDLIYKVRGLGKPGAPEGNCNNNPKVKPDNVRIDLPKEEYGNSQSYLIRRLQRDFPDLSAKVARGESSARAAAIEAGIIRVRTRVEQAVALIAKMDDDEKLEFKRWYEKTNP